MGSYRQIFYHIIFGTKNRKKQLKKCIMKNYTSI